MDQSISERILIGGMNKDKNGKDSRCLFGLQDGLVWQRKPVVKTFSVRPCVSSTEPHWTFV